jgi:23S rRNA (guanine2445-N2)-methyltransferase / 23S rRNA (guanine2069-N7)-methyltransferase
VKLLVNLTDYPIPACFSITGHCVCACCGGRRKALNLFCHSTATVQRRQGWRTTTTSVDLSKTYLDWARRNLSLNGYSTRTSWSRAM